MNYYIILLRAKFDIKKRKIYDPSIEEWEKYCICKRPLNPDL